MAEPRSARYELLDALRGIAILAVLLLHFSERGRESGDHILHARLWPVLQHGYLGVQLFFVISGYCITAAVGAAAGKSSPVWYFLIRRLRRIYPPYWASMLLVLGLGFLTIVVLQTPRATVFPLELWEWFSNVALLQGPLQARDANLVYWSLSIELQFYLLMAVCLLLTPRLAEVWLVLVSAASCWIACRHSIPLTGWVLNYWSEFACGIAVYYWITHRNQFSLTPWLLVTASGIEMSASFFEHDSLTFPDGRFIPGVRVAFCLIVMVIMLGLHAKDRQIVEWPVMRFLSRVGLISYSLYLIHVPIGTRVFNLGQRVTGLQGCWWVLYFLLSLVCAALTGMLFFRWFELPWLNTAAVKASERSAIVPPSAAAPSSQPV